MTDTATKIHKDYKVENSNTMELGCVITYSFANMKITNDLVSKPECSRLKSEKRIWSPRNGEM